MTKDEWVTILSLIGFVTGIINLVWLICRRDR